MSLAFCLTVVHSEGESGTLLLTPSHWVFIDTAEICLSYLFSRLLQSQLSQLLLIWQMLPYLWWCFSGLFQYVFISFVPGSPAVGTILQMCQSRAEQRGTLDHLPRPAGKCSPRGCWLSLLWGCMTGPWETQIRSPGAFWQTLFLSSVYPACPAVLSVSQAESQATK